MGYDLDSPSYRIYVSDKNDVISSENVIFDEKLEANQIGTEVQMPLIENEAENVDENFEIESVNWNMKHLTTICQMKVKTL